MNKRRAAPTRELPWLRDLHERQRADNRPDYERVFNTTREIEDEVHELQSEPHLESPPRSYADFEMQSYDEIMRIHRDSLEHPITDSDYLRVKAIVKAWRSLIPNP